MTSHKVHNLAAWDAAVRDARRLVARAQKCQLYQDCDGFDNYNTPSQRYELVAGSPSIGTAYRRFAPPAGLPGQGLYLPSGSLVRKNMLSNQITLIVKAAFYPLALGTGAASLIGVLDSGSAFQVALCWTPAGALEAIQGWQHLGSAGVQATTGPGIIAPNHWYGIEVEFTIGSSAGAVKVWVNGTQVMNASSINTQFTSNAYANQVQLGDSVGTGYYVDDYRVWDITGSTQNAPVGASGMDTLLITKLPSGAGAVTQFTPNGAAANWQCVDDNPPDDDSTYVSGATSGLTDAYAVPSAGLTQNPVMVTARARARKDDGAARQLAPGVDSSGAITFVPTVLGSTYAYIDACLPLDPNTTLQWTAAGADAAQLYLEEIV